MAKPISPQEVGNLKAKSIPDGVVQAFNDLIVEKWNGKEAKVEQGEAVTQICARMACDRRHVFNQRWLDVEDLFEQAGWRVEYDKPGYCENYEAFFVFRPGK